MPNLLLYYGGGGIENCGGFLAVNEMLLQSHEGVLRFFPCWPKDQDARFGSLRGVGAFLVSAELKNGTVAGVKIVSEKGRRLHRAKSVAGQGRPRHPQRQTGRSEAGSVSRLRRCPVRSSNAECKHHENIRRRQMKRQIILIMLLAACLAAKADELKLAGPFSDSMGLQREMAVPVWGQADASATVTVSFAGQKQSAKANSAGQWLVKLGPLTASAENRVLALLRAVPARSRSRTCSSAKCGSGSGQSNMEMGVPQCSNAAAEIAAANYPAIRL